MVVRQALGSGLMVGRTHRFREWFLEFDAATWDVQLERDSSSGKLAELAEKSLADHKSGKSTEF
jgi:hypothetical protein